LASAGEPVLAQVSAVAPWPAAARFAVQAVQAVQVVQAVQAVPAG